MSVEMMFHFTIIIWALIACLSAFSDRPVSRWGGYFAIVAVAISAGRLIYLGWWA